MSTRFKPIVRRAAARSSFNGLGSLCVGVALLASVAAESMGCVTRPPASVTCAGLRSLRYGMPRAQVVAIIGPSVETAGSTDAYQAFVDRGFGGTKLFAEYESDKLKRLFTYTKYFWSERDRELFHVDSAGQSEGPEFKKVYCPGT
jgi:hypothetical protein